MTAREEAERVLQGLPEKLMQAACEALEEVLKRGKVDEDLEALLDEEADELLDVLDANEEAEQPPVMATETEQLAQVHVLSEKEWEQMADEKAHKYFGINAVEFARRLKTGEMDVDDDPNGMRVAMLLGPLAE